MSDEAFAKAVRGWRQRWLERQARDAERAAAEAWRLLHAVERAVRACRWCAVGDCPRHAPGGGPR